MNAVLNTILIIDDEVQIRRFLKVSLGAHQFDVIEAANAAEGLSAAATRRPDLIILDLGLPDKSGLETLTLLREWYEKPILILSVRDDEDSIVSALDCGADDYLTKPFGLAELLARIRLSMRHRKTADSEPTFTNGSLTIDYAARLVTVDGSEVKLTSTEYDVLRVLARYGGKVVTHRQLLKEIWGPNATEHVQYLRVYIGHLRQKIEQDPNQPKLIVTEPGVGYRMKVSPPQGK